MAKKQIADDAIFVKLDRLNAGRVYQEVVKPERSKNPTARAFVDAGAHITLVRESEVTGVSPKNSPVLSKVLRVEGATQEIIAQAPGVRGTSRSLNTALKY